MIDVKCLNMYFKVFFNKTAYINIFSILLDLELIGVELLEFSSSIKFCSSISNGCFNLLEVDGRSSSSICTMI